MQKLNTTIINNSWNRDEMTRKIRKYFEMNDKGKT